MADWKKTLARIDAAASSLRPLVETFLATGRTTGLVEATDALLQAIPADVTARAQHPLTVTSKALAGSLRQAREGRVLFTGEPPEWWRLLDEGVRDALLDFDQELALLMKEGAAEH